MSEHIVPIKRALISVSDKTGIVELGKFLHSCNVEILSTGGTARMLRDEAVEVTEVSDYTQFPEILGGRVKTLVPKIHGGILGRRDDAVHQKQMQEHDIGPIDLVVVNLYPFVETVKKGADFQSCVENIDIGGPALIRAAAKNFRDVAVLTNPASYGALKEMLQEKSGTTIAQRAVWAREAYSATASYDSAISNWFARSEKVTFPSVMTWSGELKQKLRYGENPHQAAAFYKDGSSVAGVATAQQLHGKELSYNNINDTDAAFDAVTAFDKPAIVIVKHANPCGVAQGNDCLQAWDRALACDPLSAYGGIVACNRGVNLALAQRLSSLFLEVVIAPSFDDDACALLSRKKNIRLLQTGHNIEHRLADQLCFRSVRGGFLVQTPDNVNVQNMRVVTKRQPSSQEMRDLLFAFKVVQYVHSNAIIFAKDDATVAIGAGQMSRVDSAQIAVKKCQNLNKDHQHDPLKGSVAASDAFFPFADGLNEIIEAGACAVIQPGGSIRDNEVIAAADDAGIAMVFTGTRHFLH